MLGARRMIAVAALVAAAAPSSARARSRCGTPDRLDSIAARRRPVDRPRHAAAAKQTRDGFGGTYEVRESADFALKWTDAAVSEAKAAAWLDALEASWTFYHETMGHRLSVGADQFRINVYLHAADDSPAIDFSGGYVDLDDEGYPYVVIAEELVDEVPVGLVAHEFYHVVQIGTGAYAASFDADWYWEASAEWAAQESAASDSLVWDYIGAYAAAPELPLWFFGDFLATDVTAVHQYGASIFVRYLSERFGRDVIRDSWETAGDANDPLAVLDSLIDEPLAAGVFPDFAARNAFWDYRNRAEIAGAVEQWASERSFPSVDPAGTGGPVDGSGDHPLHSLGWTRVDLGQLAGAVEVAVDGDDGVVATVARERAGVFDYVPVDGAVDVDLDSGDQAVLIISAAEIAGDSETFDFSYSVGEPDEVSAGCSTGGGGGRAPLVVLLPIAAVRFRRRSTRGGWRTGSGPRCSAG